MNDYKNSVTIQAWKSSNKKDVNKNNLDFLQFENLIEENFQTFKNKEDKDEITYLISPLEKKIVERKSSFFQKKPIGRRFTFKRQNTQQISNADLIKKGLCFTKFDEINFQKKKSTFFEYDDNGTFKTKEEKDEIKKQLINDLNLQFSNFKKSCNEQKYKNDSYELTKFEKIEYDFTKHYFQPINEANKIKSVVIKEKDIIQKNNNSKFADEKSKSTKFHCNDENDDSFFLKKKIDVLHQQTKKEFDLEEEKKLNKFSLMKQNFKLRKSALLYNKNFPFKKRKSVRISEDEYDDFIAKTQSEHIIKLGKIRKSKTKELNFDMYLKEFNYIGQDKIIVNSSNLCLKNKSSQSIKISNQYNDLEVIKEDSKTLSEKSNLENKNDSFNLILNAQMEIDKEVSNNYIFNNGNYLVKNLGKEQSDQLSLFTAKTIQKIDISIKNPKKKPLFKLEENHPQIIEKSKKFTNKSNPFDIINKEEKEDTSLKIYKLSQKSSKKNDKMSVKKSKYQEKKEKFEQFKKFENLKRLSKLVSTVKSNHMRNLKIQFIIHQQNEKVNKEKLIKDYLDEENKLLKNNNNENENTIDDTDHKIKKKNKFILDFLKNNDIPKLDENIIKDTIFDKRENKVNYLNDCYMVPNIKNKLKCYPDKFEEVLIDENLIEKYSHMYLNYKKQTIQKENDERKMNEDNLKLNNHDHNNQEGSNCESAKIIFLRNRKNDFFQETYDKFKYRNFDYLNSFKFKYNKKKYIDFANEKVIHVIENIYETNIFEQYENKHFIESPLNSSKLLSEEICFSVGDQREEMVEKFCNNYNLEFC